MEVFALNFLGFSLVLASFTAVCFCKPISLGVREAEDVAPARGKIVFDARRLWSEARRAHKQIYQHLDREARKARRHEKLRREVRQTGQDALPSLINATSNSYMIDLYEKIRDAGKNTPFTQANSIKSLTFLKDPLEESCHRFTFSLAGVSSSELILQTKLRLYNIGDKTTARIVEIEVENSTSKTLKAMNPSENGYVEFEVADIVRPFAGKRENISFNIKDLNNSPPIDCKVDVVKFSDSTDKNTIPTLVVYSYEKLPKVMNISTELLDKQLQNSNISIEKTSSTTSAPSTTTSAPSTMSATRKRRQTPSGCTKKELQIPTRMIATDLIGDSFEVLMPETYNAGICGGGCFNNVPTSINHPILIHILLRYQTFLDVNPNAYKQCCTPISYGPLTLYGLNDKKIPEIKTIEDMIIDSCQCTDVVA